MVIGMTKLDSYVWILWVFPFLVICAVVALFIGMQFTCGNLAWLFPVGDGPIPVENERVMSPGMSIAVKSSDGEGVIAAGKGLKRFYSWNGGTRAVEMCPRQERWYGLNGLYFPGGGSHWWPHHRISRCMAEEGAMFEAAGHILE